MKTYKERTEAVFKKIDEYNSKTYDCAVENGGRTLSVKRNKAVALWTLFAAAVLALITAFNLILFLPFPVKVTDISAYKDSEYYGLISVVNKLTAEKPRYKNNFEKWTAAIRNYDYGYYPPVIDEGFGYDPMAPASPDYSDAPNAPNASIGNSGSAQKPDSSGNGNYQETTNNQVAGVTEGDLLKRSNKYAFYLVPRAGMLLRVYSLNGADSSLVSEYTLRSGTVYYYNTCEMYLSEDCNTVTVITENYDRTLGRLYTSVIGIDVSDVNNIKETGSVYVSGSYISSRLTDGNLLLFTNFYLNNNPDFSDEAQFLPQAGTPDNLKSISASNVIFDENAASARYTVVCAIDQSSLEITSDYAFLDYSKEVYVSKSNIYLTHAYSAYNDVNEDGTRYAQKTNINCISYTQGTLEYVNKATVAGFVLNQYSMDEYDGMLRVVTEVDRTVNTIFKTESYSGACLYCIDLKSFEICASFEEFSPDGEKVYSVRFDKKTAYVCTAIVKVVLTDPVFAIDLSDLDNITCKDTGTITGYSLSLTKFRDDTLLGIGYGSSRSELKIELYRETEDGVESVASFEKSCDFSQEYKAYFIDAEKGLIGLSIYDYETYEDRFILVLFDGYELKIAESVSIEEWVRWNSYDYTRAAYADGYIYVFFEGGFEVINWNA